MSTTRAKVARCRSKWLLAENILKFFACFHCSSKQMPYLCPHFPASIRNGKQSWMYFNHWERAVAVTVLSFFKDTARFLSDLPLYFHTMPTECCRGDFYRRPYVLHIINTKNLRRIQPFMYLCTQNDSATRVRVVTNHRGIAHRAQCSQHFRSLKEYKAKWIWGRQLQRQQHPDCSAMESAETVTVGFG